MGFPTVVLQGDPRARGRQYAAQAGDRIRRSLATYQRRLGRPWDEVRATVRARFLPAIAAHLPEALAEIEALAAGVGCEVADIVAIEARYELLRLADGCTSVACLPEVTGGPVLLAQNWDFHPSVLDTTVLLDIRPETGPRLHMLAEAGQHGRLGFSEDGLGICVNGLDADVEAPDQGVPISLLRRTFLLAGSLDALLAPPRTACNNVLVASAEGWAVDVELLPTSHRLLHPRHGLLVHDNDWGEGARALRLLVLLAACRGLHPLPPASVSHRAPADRGQAALRAAPRRATRSRVAGGTPAALGPGLAGRVTEAALLAALSDSEICRKDLRRPSITVASVAMDLSARRWRVVRAPPC